MPLTASLHLTESGLIYAAGVAGVPVSCSTFLSSGLFHSTNIIRMMIVNLLIQFLTGYFDVLSVGDDHIITCIFMRVNTRLFFPSRIFATSSQTT